MKQDTTESGVERNAKYPVILRCNLLRAIANTGMEPLGPSKDDWQLALNWLKLVQEGEIGCEGGESIVGTASVAVSPPGDSSDTGEEVNELIAVTHQVVMIPPMLEGGLTPAVLPSYDLEQLAQMQSDDPVLHEQSAAEECPMKTADPPVACGRSQSFRGDGAR